MASGGADWEALARKRGCYCGVWAKDPSIHEKQGLTPGYCGKCERCGAMGHARHFPGPVPYTGAWCDPCYRVVAMTGWMRSPAGWIGFLVLVVVAIFAFNLVRGILARI